MKCFSFLLTPTNPNISVLLPTYENKFWFTWKTFLFGTKRHWLMFIDFQINVWTDTALIIPSHCLTKFILASVCISFRFRNDWMRRQRVNNKYLFSIWTIWKTSRLIRLEMTCEGDFLFKNLIFIFSITSSNHSTGA